MDLGPAPCASHHRLRLGDLRLCLHPRDSIKQLPDRLSVCDQGRSGTSLDVLGERVAGKLVDLVGAHHEGLALAGQKCAFDGDEHQ